MSVEAPQPPAPPHPSQRKTRKETQRLQMKPTTEHADLSPIPSPSPTHGRRARRLREEIALLVLLVAAGYVGRLVATAYVRAGRADFLNELVFGDTKWSDGFTDSKFSSVRVGLSSAEVQGILGEPVLRHTASSGEDVWHYAYGNRRDKSGVWADCDYTERVVLFADGKVSSIRRSFYFD